MLIKFPFGLSLVKNMLVEVYLRFIIFPVCVCVCVKFEKFKVKAESNLINPSKLKEVLAFTFLHAKTTNQNSVFFYYSKHLLHIFTVFVYYHAEYLFTNESSGDSVVLKLIPRFP